MSSMKAVTVLGSTGSVGTNTLAVIDSERDKFSLFALVAKKICLFSLSNVLYSDRVMLLFMTIHVCQNFHRG
jgi:1-deoxy-D-xylulose 5-phosphate reductoisomerase